MCYEDHNCIARQALKGKLLILHSAIPDSRGSLSGDPVDLSCEASEAKTVQLQRKGKPAEAFCSFADGSYVNVKMYQYYLRQ